MYELTDLKTSPEESKSSEVSKRLELGKKNNQPTDLIDILESFYKNQIITLRYLKDNKDNLTKEEREECENLVKHIGYLVDEHWNRLADVVENWVKNEK